MLACDRSPRRAHCIRDFFTRHPVAAAALAVGLLWGGCGTNASAALTCNITVPSGNVTIQAGQSVDYTGTVSGGKSRYTYNWTFDGGTPASSVTRTNSTSNSVSGISYSSPGTYTTTLAVSDSTKPTAQTCSSNPTRTITVQSGGDTTPPTVSLAASPAGPTYTSAQTVALTATASDNSGTVSKVEFYDGSTLVATDTASPFTYAWSITNANNGTHNWTATAYDPSNNSATSTPLALTVNISGPPTGASINSTSQSCGQFGQPACGSTAVTLQPAPTSDNSLNPAAGTGLPNYQVVATNDLGMHCGDLDTRVLSILPPYNVLNIRVIKKPTAAGGTTTPLTSADVNVYYSAGSSSTDPALTASNPAGYDAPAGSVYKTNYWSTAAAAYDALYPAGVLPLFYPSGNPSIDIADVGLAVPNLELWYLNANGNLLPTSQQGSIVELDEQGMPAITTFTVDNSTPPVFQPTSIASIPYAANQPQKVKLYVGDWPFFPTFPFGYVAKNLDWFTAEAVPLSTYDDLGRLNSYPLMRIQATAAVGNSLGLPAGTMLATVDTVAPISAEADCRGCHADLLDGNYAPENTTVSNNIASKLGTSYMVTSDQDPLYGTVPVAVSVEWAADKNILRLHDYNEGTKYTDSSGASASCDLKTNPSTTNTNCLVNRTPIVCQTCHYSPALDLLQVGPNNDNGRVQANNQSMSRVMHNFHGLRNAAGTGVSTSSNDLLFPYMAPAGSSRDTQTILGETCYQCHPGKTTKCLRGAMANAGVVCQDCHGQMTQVGDDFSKNMPGGSFILANDYYTSSTTPRVPWANEPSCGSCHTGDFKSNLAGTAGTITNAVDTYGNIDDIRLDQAYRTSGNCTTQAPGSCPKPTPIVPTNKRFAEDVIDPAATTAPGTNPKLYRVSVGGQSPATSYGFSNGHGPLDANGNPQPGLFCEACHGPTHAEWPVDPPNANDNATAIQLQGHARVVSNCSTCHGSTKDNYSGLGGPHGLHTIGDNVPFANSNVHRVNFANNRYNDADYQAKCQACHGGTTRGSSCGTVLSRAQADRTLKGTNVPQGKAIGCTVCHKADRGVTCP